MGVLEQERNRAFVQAEALFFERWPQYREWLDETRVRQALEERLATIRRNEEPFPLLTAEPFLPEEFYRLLQDAWPPTEAFHVSQKGRKFELEPRRGIVNDATASYAMLPTCFQEVWDFFTTVVNQRIVGPWLADVFKPEIDEQLERFRALSQRGPVAVQASGLSTGMFGANVGRLMMRGPGYVLPAHVDPFHFLVTVLLYFGGADSTSSGTMLFKAARSIPAETVLLGGSKYFQQHDITTEEVGRLPFTPNTLLAFPNLLNAAHGALGPTTGLRRVFQYHLSLRGDQEPL